MQKFSDVQLGVMEHEVVYGARKKTERRTPYDVLAKKGARTDRPLGDRVPGHAPDDHPNGHARPSVHTTVISQLLKSLVVVKQMKNSLLTFTGLFFFERHEEPAVRSAFVFAKTDAIGPFVYDLSATSVSDVPGALTCSRVTTWTKKLTLFTRRRVHY
jgi:hypothetical protein